MFFWLKQFLSNREFHKRALEEVLVVSSVSIVPILLLPFLSSAKGSPELPFEWGPILWKAIEAGQLYLYAFSLFGMIIWLCVEDVSNKAFPPRKYFVLLSIVLAFLCLLVYEIDPALTRPLNPALIYVSIFVYLFYLLMYYALLVFKMLRAPDFGETLDRDATELINQSRRRRTNRHD
jgi:hypothetical protein